MLKMHGAVAVVLGGVLMAGWGGVARAEEPDKDMEALRAHFRERLLPTGEDALQAAKAARPWIASLRPDGTWPDVDYADRTPSGWKTAAHLERVRTMARALCGAGSPLHDDARLKAATLSALDHWLAKDYTNPNWWHNDIGTPGTLGETLLLLGDIASREEVARAMPLMARSDWRTIAAGRMVTWTGANLTDMAMNRIMRGLLAHDAAMVAEAFQKAWGEVRVVGPDEEGLQADMSFHQHGPLLYDGGYGAVFDTGVARLVRLAAATRFSAPASVRDLLERHILDGQQWMTRGRFYDYGVIGRSISRANRTAAGLLPAVEDLAALDGDRRAELDAFARRLRGESAPPLSGNRAFYRSDFMVHHRPGWYASARMYSRRTMNTDAPHNGEGRTSQHIADGAAFVMRRGDEYRDIFPAWDWEKVPGTTAVQSKAPLDGTTVNRMGTAAFVGGVSDGTYGCAAMDLERDGLSARKAWFFFDEGFVALGAGIRDASGDPVVTTVNQCLLVGDVRADGREAPLPPGEHDLSGARWVLHDGIGYIVAPGTTLREANAARSGRWSDIGTGSSERVTKDVFSLWIEHGAKPSGARYAYTVVPGADAERLAAWTAHGPYTVLSNTPELQAVSQPGIGLVEAAFRRPGTLEVTPDWTVSVDKPCLLLARKAEAVWVAASNPENAALAVTVTMRWRATTGGPWREEGARLELPGGSEAGRGVVRPFAYRR